MAPHRAAWGLKCHNNRIIDLSDWKTALQSMDPYERSQLPVKVHGQPEGGASTYLLASVNLDKAITSSFDGGKRQEERLQEVKQQRVVFYI